MLVSKAGIRPLSSTYTLLVGPYIMGEVRPFQKAKDCEGLNKHHAATCIPPSMDTDRLPPKTMHEPGRKVTLGWTGTFGTKTYLDSLRSVLKRLAERGAFRLLVIGNFDYTFEGIDLKVIRWSADREVQDLQEIDIGIYPLPIDDDWVLSKSGLKALQYMAVGVPMVATNVGSTPTVVKHGRNGLLVETEDQWLEALEQLIDDSELRRRLGANGREQSSRIIHFRQCARTISRYSTTSSDRFERPIV